jgi:hypothetical protein
MKVLGTLAIALLSILCLEAAPPAGYKGKPYQDAEHKAGPQVVPGRLQCALFDAGGEGVAYHDTDAINHGSGELNHTKGHCEPGVPASICYFREKEGADISYTKDLADFNHPNPFVPLHRQLYLGWQADGEWVKFTVDVKKAGAYQIVALYSNQANTVKFSVNDKPAGECKLPMATPDWHIWNKAACGQITFPEAGIQVLTLHYNTGNNFAYFDFEP